MGISLAFSTLKALFTCSATAFSYLTPPLIPVSSIWPYKLSGMVPILDAFEERFIMSVNFLKLFF